MTKGHVLKRLLVAFLPHILLFLATLVTTGTYAATMTARVVLIFPVLRIFQEDVTPEMREKLGIPEGVESVPVFTKGASGKSPGLAKANEWLDRSDRFWIGFFSYGGTAKENARFGTLCTILALFLLVAAISAGSNFAHIYLRALLVVRILISLRVRLLRNMLQQPLAFYNEQKRGELISRMGADVHGATACLDTLTGPLLHQPLAILMPAALLVAIKWWFGFLVLGFLAAIAFSVRKQTRKVHRRAKVRQRTIARVTESMVQMFSGIRVVKAFGLETAKVDQYTARNQEFARDAMATERSKAWTRTIMELLTNLMVVLVVAVVLAVLGFGGRLDPSIVLMLLVLITQMYRPAKILTRAVADLQDHLAGAGRVFEFTHLKPGLTDKPGAIALEDVVGTVRYEDVCFAYNGNGRVLDHVTLEVPAGQVVALVGPSGAGKSTLVNLVPRFYDPDQGRITIDGTDLREFKRGSLLDHMAVVTQDPFLFNTSIRENIAYGKTGATIDEIVAAAEAANIHDFILTLPRGYDTVVGDRGANISGGQCQRITIARAIIRNPRILILDEATSSLDTESERAVQQALHNLMQARTTLVIAHRLSTIKHADKICVMQDGRICEVGSHAQLMATATLYRRLYELQFAKD